MTQSEAQSIGSESRHGFLEQRLFAVLLLACLSVVVIWLVVGYLPRWINSTLEEAGQFGDTFGVVNALFSGLAFAGIIIALILQREDLQIQRQDLKLTLEEVRRSAEAQEKSERALASQARALFVAARLNAVSSVYQAHAERAAFWHGKTTNDYLGNLPRIARDKYRQLLEALLNEVQLYHDMDRPDFEMEDVLKRYRKLLAERIRRECSAISLEYLGDDQARSLAESILQEIRAVPAEMLNSDSVHASYLRSAQSDAESITTSARPGERNGWVSLEADFLRIASALDW